MKWWATVPTAAALLLLFARSSAAETDPARDLWPQATAAVDSGDLRGGDAKFNELVTAGRQLGIRRFPLYAESAASLARQARTQGNEEISAWALKSAATLDPISPNVSFTRADIAAARSQWGEVASSLLDGARNVATDYRARTISKADFLIVVCVALAATILGFAIALFFRYSRSAAHDFRELLSRRMGTGATSVFGYALLFLPLFLWLGPIWLVLYWFALFFGYATRAEKAMIAVAALLAAAIPPLLDFSAYRISGVSNPVVRSAVASIERSYDLEAIRRLRELAEVVPTDPDLQLLLGNQEVQHGNEDQAAIHYRKAVELKEAHAGAHLNIGNLHFFDTDFIAAMTEYQRAAAIRPSLAIAFYNQSVAAGELYKYDVQGQMLEEAKDQDRSLVDRILANPPQQKVVRYNLPINEAWALADRLAAKPEAREIFGNYARFDFFESLLNPLTVGAPLALIIGAFIATRRRRNGFAGACIKCGRTYCSRCKSSKESAIYCTQCIHIYLKRDGVSVDTKRQKIEEVQHHASSNLRRKKLLTTFIPGAGHIFDGSLVGVAALFVFALAVALAVFIGRLGPIAFPAETFRLVIRVGAIIVAVVVWFVMAIPVYRQKAAA